jgi:hypothetical protein
MSFIWYRGGTARVSGRSLSKSKPSNILILFGKMVDAEGAESNHLFITLANWNEILQDTSVVNWCEYREQLATTKKPPKVKKEPANPQAALATKRIGGAHGRVK